MGLKNFGSSIQLNDYKGSLLAIRYLGDDVNVDTAFGNVNAARAEVVTFDAKDDGLQVRRLGSTLVFQKAIANEIRGSSDWSVGVFEEVPHDMPGVPDATMYTLSEPDEDIAVLAAAMQAADSFQSTVIGHFHAAAGVMFKANDNARYFGMNVGCGVDYHTAAMQYGVKFARKPVLGCGVVIDGTTAIFEPMPLPNRMGVL